MKTTNFFYRIFFCLTFIFITSCSDDDDTINVDSTPEFASIVNTISSLPGSTVVFQAELTDPAGIRSVRLQYEEWFLDKIITLDSLPQNYALNFSFLVPVDADDTVAHTIVITGENAGGVQTQQEIIVTLDADFDNPEIEVLSPTNNSTVQIGDGDEVIIELNLTDNQSLAELTIESSVFTETVSLTGTAATYTANVNIDDPGLFTFNFTLTDAAGNEATTTRSVNVVDELNFLNMFLADDTSSSSFTDALAGYPFDAESSTVPGEEGFVFTIQYFADEDNKEVRFVAQKSGFGPFTFGADPDVENALIIGSDATVSPIVLGARGYYEITMDLRDSSFSTEMITAVPPANINENFTGVYVVANQNLRVNGEDLTGFGPANNPSPLLTVDPDFEFRYSGVMEFTGSTGSFIFLGTDQNFSIFWRVNNGNIEEASRLVPQGGSNCAFAIQYEGTYEVTVDIFLNTMTIIQM